MMPAMGSKTPTGRFPELIRAATHVFLKQGYRRTQMSDVAEAMGVAKGTLYLYVESKEALFDAVLRLADQPATPDLRLRFPLATPGPGDTLREVEKRVSEEASFPRLMAALGRKRVSEVREEAEGILRELYAVLSRHRTAIQLLDRCAEDHPDLSAIWYRTGREGALGLLTAYLQDRARRRLLRIPGDAAVAARIVLETVTFWAVHHHFDPSPQPVEESVAADTVVGFVLAALTEE
jgi:AcrR family transcriptional regulator